MATNKLPKPKSGGKPKKITTKNKPGSTGPGGSNPARGPSIVDLANESMKENKNGTQRSK